MIVTILEYVERAILILSPVAIAAGIYFFNRPAWILTPRRSALICVVGVVGLVLLYPLGILWNIAAQKFEAASYSQISGQRQSMVYERWSLIRQVILYACLAVAAWFIFRPPQGLICSSCGSESIRRHTRGDIVIEIILWLCAVVPGLIYSIWRRNGLQEYVCHDCNSLEIIPADSPRGLRLQQRAQHDDEE